MAPVPVVSSSPLEYDILVVGSGAGSKITRPAADLGYKVAVIEKGPLGGTCLNRGCIPSKMLIHPADVMSTIIDEAPKFGIALHSTKPATIDREKLVTEVFESIDNDSNSIAPVYEKHESITYYKGQCSFLSEKVVQVNDHVITARKIFIVVGCRAHIPDLRGLQGTPFVTVSHLLREFNQFRLKYEDVLRMKESPKSMIVLGGGYIGTELGYYLARTGVKVEFVVRSRMLSAEDPEIRDIFETAFSEKFSVHLQQTPVSVSYKDNKFTLITRDADKLQRSFTAESFFVATGVTPNTDTLKLPGSYKTNKQGFLSVDEAFRTSVDGVWAFGDVIGRNLFRHTANWEGEWVFKNVILAEKNGFSPEKEAIYPPVPHAVFTNPQVAGVGMTEPEAVKQFGKENLVIGRAEVADCAMGEALRVDYGRVKLIFKKSDKKLIGAHMVGEQASTVIHMLIAYMQLNATLDKILETIFIHPALHEVSLTARDAIIKYRIAFIQCVFTWSSVEGLLGHNSSTTTTTNATLADFILLLCLLLNRLIPIALNTIRPPARTIITTTRLIRRRPSPAIANFNTTFPKKGSNCTIDRADSAEWVDDLDDLVLNDMVGAVHLPPSAVSTPRASAFGTPAGSTRTSVIASSGSSGRPAVDADQPSVPSQPAGRATRSSPSASVTGTAGGVVMVRPPTSVTGFARQGGSHHQQQSQKSIERLSEMMLDLKMGSDKAAEIVEGDGGAVASNTQMKGLLEHAKRMVVQLKSLMGVEQGFELREANGELPSYDQLVHRLNEAFRNQQEINNINARLVSVNYMVNLSNFAKNRSMQKAIARGKRQIMELQETIVTLEESVDTLTNEVDSQKRNAERLKTSLDGTRKLLETTMLEYRKELNRQGDIIRKQQLAMGDVYSNKLNQDFIIDSSLLVFCIWLANTFVVEYPLQAVLQVTVKHGKRKVWARQAGKALIVLIVLRRLRIGAAHYGLHNRVGALVPYVSTAFNLFVSSVAKAVGLSRAATATSV
ncbi:hypothetical protein HDU96_001239 [Phlyctochytrium bullatum]|nr:hypothetical protein HDU96_001239 [Phlyctochytrium bullatum]